MKKEEPYSVLQYQTISCVSRIIGQNFIRQNNDPKHSVILGQISIQFKEKQKVLGIVSWPPNVSTIEPA